MLAGGAPLHELERARPEPGIRELLQSWKAVPASEGLDLVDADGACELVALALDALIQSRAPALRAWEVVARRLHLPRPPVHVAPPERLEFLTWWIRTFDLERPSQFGVPQDLALTLAQLSSPNADLRHALPELEGGLIPDLLGGTVCASVLYAAGDAKSGWSLCALACRLVEELRRRGVQGRQLRGFEGETLALEAALHGLDGDMPKARHLLLRAERVLGTRSRVRAWCQEGEPQHGDLVPPASPHIALRAHALWLYCRALVESASGYVVAAEASFLQAHQLYLVGGQYCMAGLAIAAVAQACLWQGRQREAVHPLETALQLLDRRALLQFGQQQEWNLAGLYALTGQAESCWEELRLLRFSVAQEHPLAGRVAGLLDWARLAFDRARRQLSDALTQASRAPLRLQLALDLAQLEVQTHQPHEARARLRHARADVETLAQALQCRWWQALDDLGKLAQLRAEVLRATDCQRVPWQPQRAGSILDGDDDV